MNDKTETIPCPITGRPHPVVVEGQVRVAYCDCDSAAAPKRVWLQHPNTAVAPKPETAAPIKKEISK